MKRSSDKNPKLPTFLDEAASAPAADAAEATATSVDTSEGGVDDTLFAAGDAAPAREPVTGGMFEDAGPAPAPANDGAAAPARDVAQEHPGRHERGIATIVLGSTVLLAGLVTTLIPGVGDAAALSGIDPTGLLVLGTVLLAAGATWRHVLRLQTRLDENEKQRREDADALRQNLQVLVEAHHADLDKPPAEGEELQHVLMSMQRQDEKINNLTKAIKMYGKPLMEITGQGTELAGGISSVKALVEGSTEAARQAMARVEAHLKAHAGNNKHAEQQAEAFADIHAALQKFGSRLEQLGNAPKAQSLEPLQQHIGRLEVTLAAVAQRLEDSEVRKSLLRLEEATQKGRESVQELLRGDLVKQSTVGLQEKVEKAAKGLADGLAKLREGQLGALEGTVREIQREVASVATSVSQIHAAMKSGAKAAAAAREASPARETPVARDSASEEAPAARERLAEPQPAAKQSAAASAAVGGGYKTGAHSTGGKNVLGAIAKLKQMKG